VRGYLNAHRVDIIAFLTWANSKGLIAVNGNDYGLEEIRADKFGYIQALFSHDKSRLAFIKHLNEMARKTA
jgi:hypothetical protein